MHCSCFPFLTSLRAFTKDASHVAAYLIAHVPPGGDKVTVAAQAVHTAAEALAEFLGLDGTRAVFDRAFELVAAQNPVLKTVELKTVPTVNISGVVEAIELHGENASASALEQLLSTVVEVLGRLMGEDLAIRILERPHGQ